MQTWHIFHMDVIKEPTNGSCPR